jgi:hypothetical protein
LATFSIHAQTGGETEALPAKNYLSQNAFLFQISVGEKIHSTFLQ